VTSALPLISLESLAENDTKLAWNGFDHQFRWEQFHGLIM
jgi:hypothetical protein